MKKLFAVILSISLASCFLLGFHFLKSSPLVQAEETPLSLDLSYVVRKRKVEKQEKLEKILGHQNIGQAPALLNGLHFYPDNKNFKKQGFYTDPLCYVLPIPPSPSVRNLWHNKDTLSEGYALRDDTAAVLQSVLAYRQEFLEKDKIDMLHKEIATRYYGNFPWAKVLNYVLFGYIEAPAQNMPAYRETFLIKNFDDREIVWNYEKNKKEFSERLIQNIKDGYPIITTMEDETLLVIGAKLKKSKGSLIVEGVFVYNPNAKAYENRRWKDGELGEDLEYMSIDDFMHKLGKEMGTASYTW